MPYAFCTLLTNEDYVAGALTLAHSLRRAGSKHDIIVLVPPSLSQATISRLYRAFTKVIYVSLIKADSDGDKENRNALLGRPDLNETLTKLRVFDPEVMVGYERVAFLDADAYAVRNVDDMFSFLDKGAYFAAAPDAGWPDIFNSGVFVARPDAELFRQLTIAATDSTSFDGADQGLLNSFFSSWSGFPSASSSSGNSSFEATRMPFTYNLTPSAVYTYLPAYVQFQRDIAIVHFAGNIKPWRLRRYSDGTVVQGQMSDQMAALYNGWWAVNTSFTKLWESQDHAEHEQKQEKIIQMSKWMAISEASKANQANANFGGHSQGQWHESGGSGHHHSGGDENQLSRNQPQWNPSQPSSYQAPIVRNVAYGAAGANPPSNFQTQQHQHHHHHHGHDVQTPQAHDPPPHPLVSAPTHLAPGPGSAPSTNRPTPLSLAKSPLERPPATATVYHHSRPSNMPPDDFDRSRYNWDMAEFARRPRALSSGVGGGAAPNSPGHHHPVEEREERLMEDEVDEDGLRVRPVLKTPTPQSPVSGRRSRRGSGSSSGSRQHREEEEGESAGDARGSMTVVTTSSGGVALKQGQRSARRQVSREVVEYEEIVEVVDSHGKVLSKTVTHPAAPSATSGEYDEVVEVIADGKVVSSTTKHHASEGEQQKAGAVTVKVETAITTEGELSPAKGMTSGEVSQVSGAEHVAVMAATLAGAASTTDVKTAGAHASTHAAATAGKGGREVVEYEEIVEIVDANDKVLSSTTTHRHQMPSQSAGKREVVEYEETVEVVDAHGKVVSSTTTHTSGPAESTKISTMASGVAVGGKQREVVQYDEVTEVFDAEGKVVSSSTTHHSGIPGAATHGTIATSIEKGAKVIEYEEITEILDSEGKVVSSTVTHSGGPMAAHQHATERIDSKVDDFSISKAETLAAAVVAPTVVAMASTIATTSTSVTIPSKEADVASSTKATVPSQETKVATSANIQKATFPSNETAVASPTDLQKAVSSAGTNVQKSGAALAETATLSSIETTTTMTTKAGAAAAETATLSSVKTTTATASSASTARKVGSKESIEVKDARSSSSSATAAKEAAPSTKTSPFKAITARVRKVTSKEAVKKETVKAAEVKGQTAAGAASTSQSSSSKTTTAQSKTTSKSAKRMSAGARKSVTEVVEYDEIVEEIDSEGRVISSTTTHSSGKPPSGSVATSSTVTSGSSTSKSGSSSVTTKTSTMTTSSKQVRKNVSQEQVIEYEEVIEEEVDAEGKVISSKTTKQPPRITTNVTGAAATTTPNPIRTASSSSVAPEIPDSEVLDADGNVVSARTLSTQTAEPDIRSGKVIGGMTSASVKATEMATSPSKASSSATESKTKTTPAKGGAGKTSSDMPRVKAAPVTPSSPEKKTGDKKGGWFGWGKRN
ncbi:hypothetical protein HK101_003083 [Irineochytrium annulatum]|nr:hypothetical protein HK101_003083 [Irineochytrium annulatum]